VHWCTECGSALAEAEVEYKDKKSDAIDVKFTLIDNTLFGVDKPVSIVKVHFRLRLVPTINIHCPYQPRHSPIQNVVQRLHSQEASKV
jgi:hypothetical protein